MQSEPKAATECNEDSLDCLICKVERQHDADDDGTDCLCQALGGEKEEINVCSQVIPSARVIPRIFVTVRRRWRSIIGFGRARDWLSYMMSEGRSASPNVAEIVLTRIDSIRSCGRYMRDFRVLRLVNRHGGLA